MRSLDRRIQSAKHILSTLKVGDPLPLNELADIGILLPAISIAGPRISDIQTALKSRIEDLEALQRLYSL